MASHAFIKLVPASIQQQITLEEVEDLFSYYKNITNKTGEQLNFTYENSAFPYECQQTDGYLSLTSTERGYSKMYVGVGSESASFLQITLPGDSKFGDKNKANEFSKFLAKKLQGELTLFNGRVMYFYKR